MKFTSFNPMIITKDAETAIALFEALGFERRHTKEGFLDDVSAVRMKDSNSFHVDVVQAPVPHDMTTIRMNVDDFDAAYEMLAARGFKNPSGEVDTRTNKNAAMISPSGFTFHLCHHIKDHD